MANQQLFDYIRQSLASGATKEDIRSALINVGWPQEEVDEALGSISLGAGSLPFQVNPEQEIKKEKKYVTIKIIVILFIIVSAFSASAAYYYLVQRPKSVLQQMPGRISDVKLFQYQINGNSEITFISGPIRDMYGGLGRPIESTINIGGSVDFSDTDKINGLLKILLDIKNPNMFDWKFGIESRFIPDVFYLKLSEFDISSHVKNEDFDYDMINYFALPLKDKWIKFDVKSVEKQAPIDIKIPSTDTATIKDKYQKIKEKYEAYSNQDLIIIKSVKSDVIDDKNVYHYQVELNPSAVGWLVQAIGEVSMDKDYDEMSQSEKDLLNKNIREWQEIVSSINNVDLYIGKDDFYPYRLKISSTLKEYKINDDIFDSESDLEINISHINQPIVVEEPQSFKSFEEVMAGIMNQLFGGSGNIK